MVKMIFSDFDETMLNYNDADNYFDDYKINVLRKLKNKGIKFAIVTGRSIPFFKQFPNLLEVIDYILASNGACIYDVKNDKFVYQMPIGEVEYNTVIDYALANDCGFLLNCKGIKFKHGIWDDTNCYEYDANDIYCCEQIMLSLSKDKIKNVLNFLEGIENININNISDVDDLVGIDVNHSDVSKGGAVIWLCNYLDVDIDDVIAFGDGENDKSLFRVINNGIAVGNAIDKLKVLSRDITLGCDNNGIYKYIEENILK